MPVQTQTRTCKLKMLKDPLPKVEVRLQGFRAALQITLYFDFSVTHANIKTHKKKFCIKFLLQFYGIVDRRRKVCGNFG